MNDLISRQAAIKMLFDGFDYVDNESFGYILAKLKTMPSAQPERLTDDDFETIRIHLSAHKEQLCNQRRWKEAEEYQRIIDRFMAFASAQPERKKGKWKIKRVTGSIYCSECEKSHWSSSFRGMVEQFNFCPNCGADMRSAGII